MPRPPHNVQRAPSAPRWTLIATGSAPVTASAAPSLLQLLSAGWAGELSDRVRVRGGAAPEVARLVSPDGPVRPPQSVSVAVGVHGDRQKLRGKK